MKKKKTFIGLVTLALGIFAIIIIIVYVSSSVSPPDPAGTTTLAEGTQMRYGDVSVALGDVNKDSAWMYFHNNKTDVSTQKQVKAGDTVDVYGYSIKINSLEKVANPSILPGSSHGYVKFIINKQK